MRQVKELVLGAGIAGLGYADELKKAGEPDVLVCEREDSTGGLCRSFTVDGFRFDHAVHLSFTTNPIARKYFDQTEYIAHKPVAYNYFHGNYLKHPIINNLYPLEALQKVDYIMSFLERNSYNAIHDYREWLLASYGERITRDFYTVYTRKYWTTEPEELSTTWIGSRLNEPDIRKMLYGAFTEDTGNDYYASEMRYPEDGGYEAFLKPMQDGVGIECNKKAIMVDYARQWVLFDDGEKIGYEHLTSSIALPELIKMMKDVPDEIENAAQTLKASKISLVSAGFNRPDVAKYLWMYLYDEDIMAARVNAPCIKSPANAQDGFSSLQFEIYHHPDECIDKSQVLENARQTLFKMKLCKEEDIRFMDYRLLPYGNVIFYKDMEKNREKARNFCKEKNITLIGRFGQWEYFWSDQSYISGKEAAERRIKENGRR